MSLTLLGVVLLIVGVCVWVAVSPAGFWLAILGLVLAIVGAVTRN